MVSKALANLTAASTLTGTELFYADSGSADVKVTANLLKSFCATSASSVPVGWISVTDYGAVGNGSTDDTTAIQNAINAAFGTSGSPHGTTATLNSVLYFPPGHYKVTSTLVFTAVRGGTILGAGRFTTKIEQFTSSTDLITTNGFDYCTVEGIEFVGNGGVCFNLDWDGAAATSLQSNTFRDCYFQSGTIGLSIGSSGSMGSENLILNCFFANQSVAGIKTCNFNALQNSVIGGDFQGCAIGIWIHFGSVPLISGVGFQSSTTADIQQDNTAGDCLTITGCRTESPNFVKPLAGSLPAKIVGCTHTSTGYFLSGGNSNTIDRCDSAGILLQQGASNVCKIVDSIFTSTTDIVGATQIGALELDNASIAGSGTGYYSKMRRTFVAAASTNFANRNSEFHYVVALDAAPTSALPDPTTAAVSGAWRGIATDASTNTFGAALVGGSTYVVPVFNYTTGWRIG